MTKRIPPELHKKRGRPRKNPVEVAQVEPEKKVGRPRKLIADETTIKIVGVLARSYCTQEEAAALLGVSRPTFLAFLDAYEEAKAVWEDGRAHARASLRSWQFKAAQAGNTQMLIWLGKQLLGQRDAAKVEQTGPDGAAINHEVQVTLSEAEREQVKAFLGG